MLLFSKYLSEYNWFKISIIFWLYLLQRIPLSVAYPFGAIAMVLVPIFSVYLFGDKLSTESVVQSFNTSNWLSLEFYQVLINYLMVKQLFIVLM